MLESLINNVADLQPCNFIKETPTKVVAVNIAKFLRIAFFVEYLC